MFGHSFIIIYIYMDFDRQKKGNKKIICKFMGNCRNYKEGKQCTYSHDICKNGASCNKQNCIFFHEQSNIRPTSKITSDICKFGSKCRNLAEGKCRFKHVQDSANANMSQIGFRQNSKSKLFEKPINQTLCKFGQTCNKYSIGKCPFKHQKIINNEVVSIPSQSKRQQNSNTFRQTIDELCTNFLLHSQQHQNCRKLHEFTLNKDIKKIFQISKSSIHKCQIFQPHLDEQKPIYILLTQGKIIFCNLLNLAKQSGHQQFPSTTMCLKRCYNKDISFKNQSVYSFDLHSIHLTQNSRIDILAVYAKNHIFILFLNQAKMMKFISHKHVVNSIFIGNHIIIVFQDKSNMILRLKRQDLSFVIEQTKIAQKLSKLVKLNKKIYGSQIAMAISDKNVYLINEQLQTHLIEIDKEITDVNIIQFENMATGLVLTKNQLIAINLLTFEKKNVLESTFTEQRLFFSSIKHTVDYLMINIDFWGVIIYKINQFQKPIGILSLGLRTWQLQCDHRGNMALLSQQLADREKSLIIYRMTRA